MTNDFAENAKREMERQKARGMRYKRAALDGLGYEQILSRVYEISEECSDVRYWFDGDIDELTAALDGDEEDAFEYRMAFSVLSDSAERLIEALSEAENYDDEIGAHYDDCTVALIGDTYKTLGYDFYEEDYYGMTSYEQNLAQTASGERLMRLTKKDMIARIGQCVGILVSFLDLQKQYDYLSSAISILKSENGGLLEAVKAVEQAWQEWSAEERDTDRTEKLDRALDALPERCWIE